MNVCFFAEHLYYLPQFLPPAKELSKRAQILFSFSSKVSKEEAKTIIEAVEKSGFQVISEQTLAKKKGKIDILVVGSSSSLKHLVGKHTKVVMLYHGAGFKRNYFADISPRVDIRFVESAFRLKGSRVHNPRVEVHSVGFAKLDPLLNQEPLDEYDLPKTRQPKILLAPTYYPSAIENLEAVIEYWPHEWQIVIKPHQFTLTNPKFASQKDVLRRISKACNNVTIMPLAKYNILPAYVWADVLVSDISSTLVEFTALDKPVVIIKDLFLRPQHKLFRKSFMKTIMDEAMLKHLNFGFVAEASNRVVTEISYAIGRPQEHAEERMAIRENLLGPCDGETAWRIANILIPEAK